jgi:hypothetical protein
MSLKGFHVVFVSASALLSFGFAAWCFGAAPDRGAGWLATGAASLLAGFALVAYEAWFVKKMRGIRS